MCSYLWVKNYFNDFGKGNWEIGKSQKAVKDFPSGFFPISQFTFSKFISF
jgi:hypothetical protein